MPMDISQSVMGERKSKLYAIRLQALWTKEDIRKVELCVSEHEEELRRKKGI